MSLKSENIPYSNTEDIEFFVSFSESHNWKPLLIKTFSESFATLNPWLLHHRWINHGINDWEK